MTPTPQPPENVRVTYADGTTIPVDCSYRGYRDGTHWWVIVNAPPGRIVHLDIDVLPGHTAVGLEWT